VHHELACLRNFALDEAENRSASLERALTSNRQIGAAVGILMAMHKLTSERAFALLREASNKSNRRLRDVADQVVLSGFLDHARELIGAADPGRDTDRAGDSPHAARWSSML